MTPAANEAGATAKKRGLRKTQQGTVTSDKMDKTLTIMVERRVRHPMYDKYVRHRTKLHAHDAENQAKVGDVVEVMETRPLSKLKRWRLVRIIRRAEG